jgi:metal-responsive CopG/Arc/MetJ family transcriptional regulator
MDDRQDITCPMPAWTVEEIDEQLEYGDSRAEWIRAAAIEKLERERAAGRFDADRRRSAMVESSYRGESGLGAD